jgi:hypothetical protein
VKKLKSSPPSEGIVDDEYKALKDENGLVLLHVFLKDLQVIEVQGKTYKLINGIDGECCVVAE